MESGRRQLAAVVMTVHDITLILTVTVELRVEFMSEGASRPTGCTGYTYYLNRLKLQSYYQHSKTT